MDQATLVNILWSISATVGVSLVGLLGWALRRLILIITDNNVAIAVLTSEVKNLKEEFRHFRNVYNDPSF